MILFGMLPQSSESIDAAPSMNVGYIGLGVMSGRMADRLMTKGHTVTGCNRTGVIEKLLPRVIVFACLACDDGRSAEEPGAPKQ